MESNNTSKEYYDLEEDFKSVRGFIRSELLLYAEIEDFVKYLEDAEVEEDSDGLTYLKTIRGFYEDKFVELNLWSCGISIVRSWIRWM